MIAEIEDDNEDPVEKDEDEESEEEEEFEVNFVKVVSRSIKTFEPQLSASSTVILVSKIFATLCLKADLSAMSIAERYEFDKIIVAIKVC